MASDFKQKEPTKNEKLIYELFMQQQQMERGLWSTSAHVVALGIILGADPAKVAELLVNGEEKIKEYSAKVNEAVKKLESEKKPAEHNHNHEGHDHSHEDHAHNEEAK